MLRSKNATPNGSIRAAVILQRALQALLVFVVSSVLYRVSWIDDSSDPRKCSALLNKGKWRDPGPRWVARTKFRNWQPPGCLLHEYKQDIPECFQQRRLVFAGDSTIRQIFWAVAKKMDPSRAEKNITDMFTFDLMSEDLEFSADGVTVQYIWDPYLNSTRLKRELGVFKAYPETGGRTSSAGVDEDESAAAILLGAPGLWHARHGQDTYFEEFKQSIDAVIPYMDQARREGMIGLSSARKESPNLLLFAPVQEPRYQNLSPSREATITPEKINRMNDYLQQAWVRSKADVIWSYSLMTWAVRGTYEESGLHVIDNVALRKADVLLNLRCNADAASQGRGLKGTCCMNYTRTSIPQGLIFIAGMVVLPTLAIIRRKRPTKLPRYLPAVEVTDAMAIFSLILCYCYYADRSHLFEDAHKQFHRRGTLTTCVALVMGGLLSVKRNNTQPRPVEHKGTVPPNDDRFLSRQQTDELKGWIQALILLSNFSNGSEKLWVYQILRALISTYLFLTGYGHTTYFLETNDYSLKRVSTVLIRMNLLSCIIPYILRVNSIFYAYIPLVNLWFLIIYATLNYKRSQNSHLDFLIEKILISALLATAFTMIPGSLELASFALKYSCAISRDAAEWRARLYLDMYIVFVGMLIAALIHRTRQLKTGQIPPITLIDSALRLTFRYPRIWKTVTIIPSLILPPVLWMITRRSPNEADYNWWHPYISCIPILSYSTLRNARRIFRGHHLMIFAWLGRSSLEMYIFHYHIWLAADGQGILQLGLWSRGIETVILTPIFLWLSRGAMSATRVLTAWIVNGAAESVSLEDTIPIPGGGMKANESRIWNDLQYRLAVIVLVLWIAGLLRGL